MSAIPFDTLAEAAKAVAASSAALAALFGWMTHRRTKTIDDAVNRRHEKGGPDSPKLYDLALENRSEIRRIGADLGELSARVDENIATNAEGHKELHEAIAYIKDPFATPEGGT